MTEEPEAVETAETAEAPEAPEIVEVTEEPEAAQEPEAPKASEAPEQLTVDFDAAEEQPEVNTKAAQVIEEIAESQTDVPRVKAKAKKAMIMGIIAAASVTSCFCFPVGIILGIIALVNVSRAKKLSITGRMPGMAIPGLICSIYGLAMSLFWLIYFGIFALIFILEGVSGGFGEEVYLALSRLL